MSVYEGETILTFENVEQFKDDSNIDLSDFCFTVIPCGIFNKFNSLKIIKLPKTLKIVEKCAFDGCSDLTKIDLSDTLITKIPEYCFFECTSLKSILFPETLEVIGKSAFLYCISLESILFPETLEVIEEGAFYVCRNLISVKLNNSKIKNIKSDAFYLCNSLKSIEIPDSIETIGNYAFKIKPRSYEFEKIICIIAPKIFETHFIKEFLYIAPVEFTEFSRSDNVLK